MTMHLIIICVVIFSALFAFINAASVPGDKKCGSKTCGILQYCSRIYNQCENCQSVCESSSHNYDSGICFNECQDYLNDQRFAKHDDFSAEIKQLRKQQMNLLIITVTLLVLFVLIHGFHLFRWLRKKDYLSFKSVKHMKNKTRPQLPIDITVANPHTQSPKMRRQADTKVNSIYSISGMDGTTVQTVSTPISNRYPAEDTTLDYTYDNVALQITPVNEKPRGETTF